MICPWLGHLSFNYTRSPAKSMHFSWSYNRMLQCKLNRFLYQQYVTQVFKFLNPTVGHRGQVLSRLLCQFRWCLTHPSFKYMQGSIVFKRQKPEAVLRHRWNRIMRWTHLGKNFIQPLEGAMQMDLNPAGGASNILAVVFCSPTLETTWEVI